MRVHLSILLLQFFKGVMSSAVVREVKEEFVDDDDELVGEERSKKKMEEGWRDGHARCFAPSVIASILFSRFFLSISSLIFFLFLASFFFPPLMHALFVCSFN